MTKYTWVPFYKELGRKLLDYRDRQQELIAILQELKSRNVTTIKLDDSLDKDGATQPLSVIDPFTFIAGFNNHGQMRPERKAAIVSHIKERLGISAALPLDYAGIPTVNPINSWFFSFAFRRQPQDIPDLWQLAKYAVSGQIEHIPTDLYERCVAIAGKAYISFGLFWLNPEVYLPLDQSTLAYLNSLGVVSANRQKPPKRISDYISLINEVNTKIPDKKYYEIADESWRHNSQSPSGSEPVNEGKLEDDVASIRTGSDGGPRNIILYGPPGTGKTYTLQHEYMRHFADKHTLTKDEFAEKTVTEFSWWEICALVLLDRKTARVPNMLDHPLMQAKIALSKSRSPKASIWGALQTHAKRDCTTVQYTQRMEPLLFVKDDQSQWSIDLVAAEAEVPELVENSRIYLAYEPSEAEIQRYEFVTFHQSYSYEEFVEGIKPVIDDENDGALAYEVKPGIFRRIAQRAAADPSHEYALFIDEINRGNVASIFGELISLIEDDKRSGATNELSVILPYSRVTFSVPSNLLIVGTMNTADRSIESLDAALRRRFSFVRFSPDASLLRPLRVQNDTIDLARMMTAINTRLEALLDRDHCIGHAYFMGVDGLDALQRVFADRILPQLEEYFYGSPAKIGMVLGEAFVRQRQAPIHFAAGDWANDDAEEYEVCELINPATLDISAFQAIYAAAD